MQDRQLPDAPDRPYAAYQMCPLRTSAEHAEAAALVVDRLDWLTRKGLPVPSRVDVPALFRDVRTESVGLFEDGVLVCCLILDLDPNLRHWGITDASSVFLRHVYTLPGLAGISVARVLTLWASDVAARRGRSWVRTEALLARSDLPADPVSHLIAYVSDLGWSHVGTGTSVGGERIARLQLAAEHRPALANVIDSTVPVPTGSPS
ncbi:hypothetical protein [Streptomyces sp. NPDC002671]